MSEKVVELNPPKPRSVSQYKTFVRCGEEYRLERVAKAPKRPAAWFVMGTAVHAAIEFFEINDRPDIGDALEEFQCVYEREVEALVEASPLYPDYDDWLTGSKKLGGKDVSERFDRGVNHVMNYVSWALESADEWRVFRNHGDAVVEFEFREQFGDVEVVGFIDQVVETREGVIYPRDIKTGSKIPDDTIQLGVYLEAMRNCFGGNIGSYGSYAMTKEVGGKIERFRSLEEWTAESLASVFTEFDVAERLGVYVPNPGDICRVCPVRDFCRVMGDSVLSTQFSGGVRGMVGV